MVQWLQFIMWFNRQLYYPPVTYFPTISTNILSVEKKCKDTQVWCCKKLWSTNEWQILWGLESQNNLTDASRKLRMLDFPRNGKWESNLELWTVGLKLFIKKILLANAEKRKKGTLREKILI